MTRSSHIIHYKNTEITKTRIYEKLLYTHGTTCPIADFTFVATAFATSVRTGFPEPSIIQWNPMKGLKPAAITVETWGGVDLYLFKLVCMAI